MRRNTSNRTKLTPPEVARQWGVAPEKVRGFIDSGQLPAMNVATRVGGRPRYLIDVADLAAFEARRSTAVPKVPAAPRRRKRAPEVIEFF